MPAPPGPAPAADAPAAPPDPLNDRYLRLLREYDGRAVRFKRWRLRVWAAGLFCTWAPLGLALAGLAGSLGGSDHLVLKVAIPAVHTLGTALVVVQVLLSFRGWWLRYRAAAERLRDRCMRFRARARPYDGPGAEAAFAAYLDRLEAEMNPAARGREWWAVPRRVRAALGLERQAWRRVPSPPDDGLRPRAGDPGTTPADDAQLVLDRLAEQRQWHLRKAGYFYRRYVGWQVLLVLTYGASMGYVLAVGHAFEVVALVASVGLILTAVRDFLEYGPLSLRYAQLADALDRVDKEHPRPAGADPAAHRAWVAALAAAVEDRLASEFRAWYLVQETVPTG